MRNRPALIALTLTVAIFATAYRTPALAQAKVQAHQFMFASSNFQGEIKANFPPEKGASESWNLTLKRDKDGNLRAFLDPGTEGEQKLQAAKLDSALASIEDAARAAKVNGAGQYVYTKTDIQPEDDKTVVVELSATNYDIVQVSAPNSGNVHLIGGEYSEQLKAFPVKEVEGTEKLFFLVGEEAKHGAFAKVRLTFRIEDENNPGSWIQKDAHLTVNFAERGKLQESGEVLPQAKSAPSQAHYAPSMRSLPPGRILPLNRGYHGIECIH